MISHYSSKLTTQILPFLIGSATIGTMLFACNSGETTENIEEGSRSGYDSIVQEAKEEDTEKSVYYMLPSPLQIAHIFRKSGLKYVPNITNDPENVSNYISETSKLQNLGIYSADLCYMALNRQVQQELVYFKAIVDLSNDLGFSSIFSSGAFVDRFQKNISSEDSVLVLLTELQERMDFYLQDAEMEDKSTIIFSGAWTESIYISLAGYKLEKEESKLSFRIYEQLYILNSLIKKLEAVWEPSEEVKTLTGELTALRAMVDDFAFMKDARTKERVLLKELSISDKELAQLTEKVEEMRTKIVSY